jgi:hypothetical protein
MDSVTTPIVQPGTYTPISVHMGDSLGVLFLGVLACVLLANWVRAEARFRALTEFTTRAGQPTGRSQS